MTRPYHFLNRRGITAIGDRTEKIRRICSFGRLRKIRRFCVPGASVFWTGYQGSLFAQVLNKKSPFFNDDFLTRHVGHLTRLLMAPGVGFEPTTRTLTACRSAAELPRNNFVPKNVSR